MKKGKLKPKKESIQKDVNINLNPNDSLNPIKEGKNEEPEIYKIFKRGNSINRKDFIKSSTTIGGLAALGALMQGCEESYLDIETDGKNCTCHAVCACNTDWEDGNKYDKGYKFESQYDEHHSCTCDTVCTCNSVCTCDAVKVCSCDSEGGGYTYWYPN